MSLSPESFDRLLADKLAQAPEPSYDPAHWDQLEDQLQHLNQALRQQPGSQAAPHTPHMPVPSAALAPLAKVGVVALLAGLTAVNGYFFFGAPKASTPAVTTSAPMAIATPPATSTAPLEEMPESPAALPADAATNVAAVAPTVIARVSPVKKANRPMGTAISVAETVAAPPVKVRASAAPTPALPSLVVPATVVQPAGSTIETTSTAVDNTLADRTDSSTTRISSSDIVVNRLAQDVPNVITPNGDGKNDRFELPLPIGTCRLVIYDQRNRMVFSSQQYDNTWDANGLPAGNYFYLVETVKPTAWRSSGKIEVVK